MRPFLNSLAEKRSLLFLSLIAFFPISRAVLFVRNQSNRSIEEYASVDLHNSMNIVATALMIVLVLRPGARLSALNMVRGPTQWLVLYHGFCVVSSVWSSNPVYVVYRAVELIAVLFFMAYILDTIRDPTEGILYLCRFSAVTALLPYLSQVARSGAAFQHTNAFSTCGAFGAALALAAIKSGVLKFADVKYSLAACLVAVVFGTSAASNISLIVGILMIAASKGRAISIGRLALLSVVVFFVLTWGFEAARPYLFPGKTTEHVRSLRGRALLFEDFLGAFQERPLLGHGFASGEKSVQVYGYRVVNSTHNAILSVAVNTGIVGLLFFCTGFYRVVSTLYKADLAGYRVAYPILVAMIVGLFNSMAYPLVGSDWRYTTTPFLGIVAYASIFVAPMYQWVEDYLWTDSCDWHTSC